MTIWGQLATTRVSVDLNGTMTDITDYALTVGSRGQQIRSQRGRSTELSRMDPSTFSVALNNADGRFTPGNTAGAYYPYWKQGRRIQWTETIGHETFVLFDGYMEIPEVQLTYEADGEPTRSDRFVTITAVDRLTWLGRTRPFVSTLTEYIRSDPTGTLVHYWPPAGTTPWFDLIGNTALRVTQSQLSGQGPGPVLEFEDGPVAPADDLDVPGFTPGTIGGYSLFTDPLSVAMAANEVITLVAWIRPTAASGSTPNIVSSTIVENSGSSALDIYETSTQIVGEISGGALTGTINSGILLPLDVGLPVAIRYGYTPSVFELWIGSNQLTGSLSGSAAATSSLFQLTLGSSLYTGRIGHIQVHQGNAFTFADFQAQHRVGQEGHERQTTGERIRSILGYAGVPESDMDLIDTGSSVMQVAALAGKTAAQAVQEAADTERGRLFTTGHRIAFHDRRRIYNG